MEPFEYRNRFADRFAERAADSDYSRYSQLQDTTSEDIRAAAEALWWKKWRSPEDYSEQVTEADVIEALLAKAEYYSDDNHLVSVVYETYWDMTDKLGLPSGLLQQMEKALSRKYLDEKRAEGFAVVNNDHGIWLYRFEG
jgi:hypothetical protein